MICAGDMSPGDYFHINNIIACKLKKSSNNSFDRSNISGGIDSCQGDSGGPLFLLPLDGNVTEARQIGVVSWGRGCAISAFPGKFSHLCVLCQTLHVILPNSMFTYRCVHSGVLLFGLDSRQQSLNSACRPIQDDQSSLFN
jgi:hypothetical protein